MLDLPSCTADPDKSSCRALANLNPTQIAMQLSFLLASTHMILHSLPFLVAFDLVQTVENVFDFSFFVKSGEGAISMDEVFGLTASWHSILFFHHVDNHKRRELSRRLLVVQILRSPGCERESLVSCKMPSPRLILGITLFAPHLDALHTLVGHHDRA